MKNKSKILNQIGRESGIKKLQFEKELKKAKITVVIEITETGFSAFTKKYPVFAVGNSITEIQKKILEALNFYFEEEKLKVTNSNMHFEIDLKQFFQFYRVLNSKFLAERIGMNPTLLSQYVQGRKKPSLSQTEKIFLGINEIGKELIKIRFLNR